MINYCGILLNAPFRKIDDCAKHFFFSNPPLRMELINHHLSINHFFTLHHLKDFWIQMIRTPFLIPSILIWFPTPKNPTKLLRIAQEFNPNRQVYSHDKKNQINIKYYDLERPRKCRVRGESINSFKYDRINSPQLNASATTSLLR